MFVVIILCADQIYHLVVIDTLYLKYGADSYASPTRRHSCATDLA